MMGDMHREMDGWMGRGAIQEHTVGRSRRRRSMGRLAVDVQS